MAVLLTDEVVQRGDRACLTCGKVHNAYKVAGSPERWGSWEDPDDGHAYRTESDESLLARYVAEFGPLPPPTATGR